MTQSRSNRDLTALITGASRGIGAALSKRFAQAGYDIIAVARGEERLLSVAREITQGHNVNVEVIVRDLSKPEAPNSLYEEIKSKGISVTTLVNNAGVAGTYGPFHETDVQKEQTMMQVNMVTPVHLTKLFSQDMVENGSGEILNIASTAAFSPGPMMAVYHGTKSFFLVFSEAIAEELRECGVTVTILCPGRTNTGFLEHAGIHEPPENRGQGLDPSEVAEAGYTGLQQGKTVVFPSRKDQLTATLTQLMPRSVVRKIALKREMKRNRET